MSPLVPLVQLAGGHHPISLDEAVDGAAMMTRTDRKYLVGPDQLAAAVAGLRDGVRVLEIEGHRAFPYRTVYFDTPDLVSYMGAARGRPHRFKVRTRTYLDSGTCWLEVKVRNGRDQTVKHRMEYRVDDADVLTADGRAFVAELVDLPGAGRELRATLATAYTRTTFVVDAMRMTVDADLVCTHADGRSVGAPDLLVVETKSAGPTTPLDRSLWAEGVRPVSISKYAVGMALLDPTLPAHKWTRVLRRLGRTPLNERTPR